MASESKFEAMKRRLSTEPSVKNPGAVAAAIGDKKYGKDTMERAAKSAVPASSFVKNTK